MTARPPGSRGSASKFEIGRPGHQVGTDGENCSNRDSTDEPFADPDQGVDPGHRRQHRGERCSTLAADGVLDHEANDDASTARNPATIVAAMAPPVVFGQHPHQEPEERPSRLAR